MTRNLLATIAIACLVLEVAPSAQTRPDLSGKWTLADSLDSGIFGRSFTAIQNATTLTIESNATDLSREVSPGAEGSQSSRTLQGQLELVASRVRASQSAASAQPQRWTYSMAAADRRETHPRPAWVDNADQSRKLWSYMESSTERAVWLGDLLVVVSHYYYRTHWPEHTPAEFPTETTTRISMSLDGANRLVVERVVIADPLPGNSNARIDVPSVRRSVYTKAPQSSGSR